MFPSKYVLSTVNALHFLYKSHYIERMEAEAETNRVVEEMKAIKSKELARLEKELTVKQV